jgi:hypothetical protein
VEGVAENVAYSRKMIELRFSRGREKEWFTGTGTRSGSNAKDWIFFRVINWIQKRVDLTVWAE